MQSNSKQNRISSMSNIVIGFLLLTLSVASAQEDPTQMFQRLVYTHDLPGEKRAETPSAAPKLAPRLEVRFFRRDIHGFRPVDPGDLQPGSAFRIVIKANVDAFLYVFQQRSPFQKNGPELFFPSKLIKTVRNPIRGLASYMLPDSGDVFRMDKAATATKLRFVLSRHQVPGLQHFAGTGDMQRVNAEEGQWTVIEITIGAL